MRTPQVAQVLNRLRMRQVALLLAIDECGTLSAAAKAIGMTQPAATKMLGELEETLGQKLFARVGRLLRINEAGERALLSFRGVRGTLELLQRELYELQLGHAGRLSIGSIMAASPTYLTLALAKLKKQLPLVSVEVEVGTSDRLMEQLDEGGLDVVIGRIPGAASGYHFLPLSEEPISLVCAPGHPLAKARSLRFERLLQYPWVLQPEGTPMHDAIIQEFQAHHTSLPPGLLETSSTLITVHLVSRTEMIAALPQSVAKGFQKHRMLDLLRYELRNRLASYGSITRADRPVSIQAEHFLRLLHEGGSDAW
ncbi:LysR family transcriptional regulator [Variovorax sp. Root411]|uniref:LysR family transcriptional regulator n=1 Tax=Variovorax sp. Root411 TaxID=1736530 RepID=UPI0006FC27F4|nr:LysR family transcriptional regulator [Variovorax sp. Root411]KQW64923.1 LysR family transcriptional regulator [Variovorax sp. Root411]